MPPWRDHSRDHTEALSLTFVLSLSFSHSFPPFFSLPLFYYCNSRVKDRAVQPQSADSVAKETTSLVTSLGTFVS